MVEWDDYRASLFSASSLAVMTLNFQAAPVFLTPRRMSPHLPLFIFLPGMDGTGKLLRSQTEGLETGFDVRCLAIPPNDLNPWPALTQQVVTLIRSELQKRDNKTVYLCGESFGGCLAMKVAIAAPELFCRLILINPASSLSQRPLLQWAAQFTPCVPDWFYQLSTHSLVPILAATERMTLQERNELLTAMRSVPAQTAIWRVSLVRDFDVTDQELQRLELPVLVIASGHDQLLPSVSEAHRLVKRFPRAQMMILPYSGHACLLETETNLYNLLKAQKFLEPAEAKQAGVLPGNI